MIYENINCLRDNSYDNIEDTIDNILSVINEIIIGAHNPFQIDKPNTPFYTYFEFSENKSKPSENTIVQFCKTLITNYDYPKNKIIDFLLLYIKNRFKLLNNGKFQKMISKNNNTDLQINMLKSYNILFENWIKTEGPKLSDEYSNIMKNLFIINKSYMHYSNDLNPDYDYVSMKNIILETPMYLYSLINDTNSSNDIDEDLNIDDYEEIEFEDVDYLYDELSNKVYTMDGIYVGSWSEEEGIVWINTPTVKKIKESNHK
jgi:hypothetical protein